MLNPARAITKQFLLQSPLTLLGAGIVLSVFDFAALYGAAAKEGVLHVRQGVGLLENYGLLSTLVCNCICIYLAREYYESIHSITKSKAVTNRAPIERPLSILTSMIKMDREYKFLIYLFMFIGSAYWLSNVGFHVLGNPEIRWGHKVYDSPDHWLTFCASRLHNLYTWVVVLPLLGHVMIYASIQLRKVIEIGAGKGALQYDLLNPDQKGGFLFIEKSHVAFNIVIALVYIQITLYIETFAKMHLDHMIAYASVTLLLIGINRIFLGDIYATIKTLKLDSLNSIKDKVYGDDKLSFEILKYCYERRINEFSIVNFSIKAGAILISGVIKLWPTVFQDIQRSLR
jgi:hypothetical protein